MFKYKLIKNSCKNDWRELYFTSNKAWKQVIFFYLCSMGKLNDCKDLLDDGIHIFDVCEPIMLQLFMHYWHNVFYIFEDVPIDSDMLLACASVAILKKQRHILFFLQQKSGAMFKKYLKSLVVIAFRIDYNICFNILWPIDNILCYQTIVKKFFINRNQFLYNKIELPVPVNYNFYEIIRLWWYLNLSQTLWTFYNTHWTFIDQIIKNINLTAETPMGIRLRFLNLTADLPRLDKLNSYQKKKSFVLDNIQYYYYKKLIKSEYINIICSIIKNTIFYEDEISILKSLQNLGLFNPQSSIFTSVIFRQTCNIIAKQVVNGQKIYKEDFLYLSNLKPSLFLEEMNKVKTAHIIEKHFSPDKTYEEQAHDFLAIVRKNGKKKISKKDLVNLFRNFNFTEEEQKAIVENLLFITDQYKHIYAIREYFTFDYKEYISDLLVSSQVIESYDDFEILASILEEKTHKICDQAITFVSSCDRDLHDKILYLVDFFKDELYENPDNITGILYCNIADIDYLIEQRPFVLEIFKRANKYDYISPAVDSWIHKVLYPKIHNPYLLVNSKKLYKLPWNKMYDIEKDSYFVKYKGKKHIEWKIEFDRKLDSKKYLTRQIIRKNWFKLKKQLL